MKIGQKSDIRPFCTKAFNCSTDALRAVRLLLAASFKKAQPPIVILKQHLLHAKPATVGHQATDYLTVFVVKNSKKCNLYLIFYIAQCVSSDPQ